MTITNYDYEHGFSIQVPAPRSQVPVPSTQVPATSPITQIVLCALRDFVVSLPRRDTITNYDDDYEHGFSIQVPAPRSQVRLRLRSRITITNYDYEHEQRKQERASSLEPLASSL